MKTCLKCKEVKPASEFYVGPSGRLKNPCKKCSSEYHKELRRKFPEKIRARNLKSVKAYQKKNPEKVKRLASKRNSGLTAEQKSLNASKTRNRRKANPALLREQERQRRLKNIGRARERANNYCKKRYASNPQVKLSTLFRTRIRSALCGAKKSWESVLLLGCSVAEFKSHLESLFKPGMTWANHGPVWHIDHIKPCAAFDLTDPEQQLICFHWSNQQPLFALENQSKGGRYASIGR